MHHLKASAFATLATIAALAGASSSQAGSGTPISACGQTVTGKAYLAQDLNCSGHGIVVGADGVTIDLKGHSVNGDKGAGDYGIFANGYDGLTVKNGTVRRFQFGVDAANGANHVTISTLVVSGNALTGIYVNGDDASVQQSTAAANGLLGIDIAGVNAKVSTVTVAGNNASGLHVFGETATVTSVNALGNHQDGIYLESSYAKVTSSVASGNTLDGIAVSGGNVVIKGNQAMGNGFVQWVSNSSGKGIYVTGFNGMSPPTGTNTAAGNDDLSNQCLPASLCGAGSPQAPSGAPVSACGQTVTGSVYLTQNLTCGGDGIIVGANDVTIDLRGYSVIGDQGSGDYGIDDTDGYDGLIVKNGTVRQFDYGIKASGGAGADDVSVTNVVASANISKGIWLYGSDDSVQMSTVTATKLIGLELAGGNAKATSNTVAGNGTTGLYLGNDNATVTSVTAGGNGSMGIWVWGDTAKITKSLSSGNAIHGIKVMGKSATIKTNTTNANGFDAWTSDLFGSGVYVTEYAASPPTGTNVAGGSDTLSDECLPANLC